MPSVRRKLPETIMNLVCVCVCERESEIILIFYLKLQLSVSRQNMLGFSINFQASIW